MAPLRDADLRWADYVMISAMIVHKESVHKIIDRCRVIGRPVIGGGPLFNSLQEDWAADVHCVGGEAEDVMGELARDIQTGQLRQHYQAAERPDIAQTPVPRWDLIDFRHYVTMLVQFSRGCPYDCEFCDIVIMNGKVPRTKSVAQMLAELDSLHQSGWRDMVFLVDDNFIGNKARVKEFLVELVRWRKRTGSKMGFFTEASVNLADDKELLSLMVQAGFRRVFLGIETPVRSSLEECHKVQNTRRNLAESIRTIQSAGLEVMGGFIVGFDNDPTDIFELQFDFIQKAGIVTAMVGLLTALPQTRLYQRLSREGRLLAETTGNNTAAVLNFVPRLDRQFLDRGLPPTDAIVVRAKTVLPTDSYVSGRAPSTGSRLRLVLDRLQGVLEITVADGCLAPRRAAFWLFFSTVLLHHPGQVTKAMTLAIYGHHFRRVAAGL